VAHQDANIIFGTVIDDEMGDEVKVTVIAAGFDRPEGLGPTSAREPREPRLGVDRDLAPVRDLFGDGDPLGGDDDFDVPSFLK
jgi:cell division protein FtsZ